MSISEHIKYFICTSYDGTMGGRQARGCVATEGGMRRGEGGATEGEVSLEGGGVKGGSRVREGVGDGR